MDIAFCYESVLPQRGGCETYIATLARRLVADGHDVHLYACNWDADALPSSLHFHRLTAPQRPRFLRPWFFNAACKQALEQAHHQVTVGFDKILDVDVVYPQGGLYIANIDHNFLKYRHPVLRKALRWFKAVEPAHRSFLALERRQYRPGGPMVIAISNMVRQHLQHYYGVSARDVRVVRIATDPHRWNEYDRPARRQQCRQSWGLSPKHVVGLFAGMNYRLKGLVPLLHAVQRLPVQVPFALVVAGKPQSASFERLARHLGVHNRVRFVGYCRDMRDAYFASDFLVHPTFYDPCSNVVLEALACGLPVITSRFNGASELMHPPAEGYVIDNPHNHDALADALVRMFDPGLRSACAHAARRTASEWTFEHHYRQLLAVFEEAATRKLAA